MLVYPPRLQTHPSTSTQAFKTGVRQGQREFPGPSQASRALDSRKASATRRAYFHGRQQVQGGFPWGGTRWKKTSQTKGPWLGTSISRHLRCQPQLASLPFPGGKLPPLWPREKVQTSPCLFPENKNLSVCVYEKTVSFPAAESAPPPLGCERSPQAAGGVQGGFLLGVPASLSVGGGHRAVHVLEGQPPSWGSPRALVHCVCCE